MALLSGFTSGGDFVFGEQRGRLHIWGGLLYLGGPCCTGFWANPSTTVGSWDGGVEVGGLVAQGAGGVGAAASPVESAAEVGGGRWPTDARWGAGGGACWEAAGPPVNRPGGGGRPGRAARPPATPCLKRLLPHGTNNQAKTSALHKTRGLSKGLFMGGSLSSSTLPKIYHSLFLPGTRQISQLPPPGWGLAALRSTTI